MHENATKAPWEEEGTMATNASAVASSAREHRASHLSNLISANIDFPPGEENFGFTYDITTDTEM
jgi:hypothetical protein